MKNVIAACLIFSLGLLTVKCTKADRAETFKLSSILNDPSLTKNQKAEALADLGQRLFYYYRFDDAMTVLDMALKIDPNHTKAKFYKSFEEPLETIRGMHARVRVLNETYADEEGKAGYKDYPKSLPEGPFKEFMTESKQPQLKDENDLRKHGYVVRQAMVDLRNNLKKMWSKPLTLTVYVPLPGIDLYAFLSECAVEKQGTDQFTFRLCQAVDTQTVKMEYADWLALDMRLTAMQVMYTHIIAYNLDGYFKVVQKQKQEVMRVSDWNDQILTTSLKSQPQFLKLLDPSILRDTLNIVSESGGSINYLAKEGLISCTGKPGNKLGVLDRVFQVSICAIDPKEKAVQAFLNADKGVQTIEVNVGEKQMIVGKDDSGYPIVKVVPPKVAKTQANFATFLLKPVSDLKSIFPDRFDRCGRATGVPDNTVGGVFPEGDGLRFLRAVGILGNTHTCGGM